jgi:hypothetical protein
VLSGGSEARIQLLINEKGEEELRSSWWKGASWPFAFFDLSERDLITLFSDALAKEVLSEDFEFKLKRMLYDVSSILCLNCYARIELE